MADQIYTFKVSMKIAKQNIFRTMEVKGEISLHDFAKVITSAFNFQFDHSFGFYNNIKDIYESSEAYTLFFDSGSPVNPCEKSVKHNHIHKVFQPGKKMTFLFDYGDDWTFLVECLGVGEPVAAKKYPIVIAKKGTPPEQYPPNSEDDFDDDDDEELDD